MLARCCQGWEEGPGGRARMRALAKGTAVMCGIVGAIADRDVVPVLIEAIKELQARIVALESAAK